jgi:2-hydroxy-3-keto-5-methylthiopentenyl-1-phosphate phosphatase
MGEASLFIDFDGTISPVDISNTFFTRFASEDAAAAVDEWKQGLISSRDCLRREVDAYQGDFERLKEFSRRQPIDPGFTALREECLRRGIDVFVVSDGLDFYIEPFLAAHGVTVDLYSNRLVIENGRPALIFPYYNEDCGTCANCKSSHVEREKRKGKLTIYVGDGLSDKCAVSKADVVFAKGELKRYCNTNNIKHFAFEVLSQVADRIRSSDIGRPLKSNR